MKRFIDSNSPETDETDEQRLKKTCTRVPRDEWRCRVARYLPGMPKPPHHSYDGNWINVLIHVRDPLSPYVERDANGHLLENVYQGAKVYERVSAQAIAKHRYRQNDIVWRHPAETHVISQRPLVIAPEYWQWREKLAKSSYAVRYPNGFQGRHKALGSLWPARSTDVCDENNSVLGPDGVRYILLSYIEARKRIYCGLYAALVANNANAEFVRLQNLLGNGKGVQIWEVDGPNPQWPEAPFNSLTDNEPGLDMHDLSIVHRLLNDPTHSFGHGYTIAAMLLHGTDFADRTYPIEPNTCSSNNTSLHTAAADSSTNN